MTTISLSLVRRLLIVGVLAGLVACSGEPPTPVYVIITTDPNADLTANAPPPPPTLEPTPTVAPESILRLADRYLLNGYYEDAVAAYQVVLTQPGTPDSLRAEAAYNQGRAALREGLFDQAVASLTAFIDQFGADPRRPQAHFLRGDAFLGLSQWQNAISDFEAYLAARPGLVDSYAHQRIADARLALGQTNDALASYQRAVDASRSLLPLVALRERLAQIYLNNNRLNEAIAQYDAILSVAQNAAYRATIEFTAGKALVDSAVTTPDNLPLGLERLRRVFDQYPDRPQAYTAMTILQERGVTLDAYARGRVAFFYGDYDGAIEALVAHTTTTAIADIPAQLYMLLGRAYREIGNTAAAVTSFQTIVEQYRTDPLFGEALLEQGRTRFIANDIPGAIQRYLEIARTYDYLPEAPEALWRAGYLYSTNDNPTEARTIFEQLADKYPNTQQARDGLFLAATNALTAGDSATAERFFAELAVKASGEDQAAAYLQVGRLALARGANETAAQALQAAINAAPDSYYAARAHDIAAGVQPFQRPAQYRFQFDDAAEIAQMEDWLRATFNIEAPGALWTLSPELQADLRLVRGSELWTVAAIDEAETEFTELINANETNPLASYQLAIYLRGIGAYYHSIFAAANVIRAANVATLSAPGFIARMRYPVYYLDVALAAGERYQVDPLLLFSLIRLESLFDTYATAAAGEKGLTQVIPSTGDYIAGQIQFPDYQHSDLFRPYAGIEFGAFYLSEQLRFTNGNVVAALAGYNAGPGRAATWLRTSGGDPDLFMNAITISSTRMYVQRIYGFYNIYRALYGA